MLLEVTTTRSQYNLLKLGVDDNPFIDVESLYEAFRSNLNEVSAQSVNTGSPHQTVVPEPSVPSSVVGSDPPAIDQGMRPDMSSQATIPACASD